MADLPVKTGSQRDKFVAFTQAFTSDLITNKPIENLSSHFSTTFKISIHEHGDPTLAPFLGRTFHDPEEYLSLIADLLAHEGMKFTEDFVVDTSNSKVVAKGSATWTWKETKKSWNESFVYILDFDDEGKITDWNIRADTGAAYLAGPGLKKD